MSLALVSLLQPRLPFIATAEANWKAARMSTTDNTSIALRGVLDLPLHEAQHIIEEIKPSSAPLATMANHVTLLHLNDMFSRFFIALVKSSTSQLKRPSITAMLSNVDKRGLSAQLPPASFKDEMRMLLASVPHGSSARALALVLTGLWSIFNQSASEAQAALASSLAAEQLQGAGAQLKSVTALLQLLFPGSSTASLESTIDNALDAVDALAKQTDALASVCVELVRLIGSSSTLPGANATRTERLEASTRVKNATLSLRAMLAQPAFERLSADSSDEETDGPIDGEASDTASESGSSVALQLETVAFAEATERLVEVLTAIGRRAAGRRDGRDQDSGLEGDVDEL